MWNVFLFNVQSEVGDPVGNPGLVCLCVGGWLMSSFHCEQAG